MLTLALVDRRKDARVRYAMSGPAIGTYEGEQVTIANSSVGRSRNLVLAAMIFAVAMTFIDQTIVSIAVPQIQKELGLTSTGVQLSLIHIWFAFRDSSKRTTRPRC